MCLPLLISRCTVKSRSSLLAPADPGGRGKNAVNGCGGGGMDVPDIQFSLLEHPVLVFAVRFWLGSGSGRKAANYRLSKLEILFNTKS